MSENENIIKALADKQAQICELNAKVDHLNYRFDNLLKSFEMGYGKINDHANKEIDTLIKIKNDTYRERNMCIAALANLLYDIALPGFRVYVSEHEGDDWEDDWRTVLVIQKDSIQMTWHFHDSEKYLLLRLPKMSSYYWDGHDTKEKYNRLLLCFVEVFNPLNRRI